mmetsp:Transcript_12749/g.20758  ORF Transcript_12749/g.20758 Transcript_12749/m.20758 type:complete len:502 (+) Transcript_12749:85-1590(+)
MATPAPVLFCNSESAAQYWNSHSHFYVDEVPSSGTEGVRRRYKVQPPNSQNGSRRTPDDRSDSDRFSVSQSPSKDDSVRKSKAMRSKRRKEGASSPRRSRSKNSAERKVSKRNKTLRKQYSDGGEGDDSTKATDKKVETTTGFTRNQILGVVWFVWLLLGSCFYIVTLDLNIATGFYMAVNIGYSIGFGDISESGSTESQIFSTVYVLIGASFVGAALGIFAEHIVADKDNWYEQEKENLIYEENIKDCNFLTRALYFYIYHKDKLRSVILWIFFIVIATIAAWYTNDEFGFVNALYFAVSSLSTGGHYSLPAGNKEWIYGLTGLYCAFGVPLMGVAMATIASFFINVGSIEDTLKDMKKPISQEEVDMMTEFGLADDDGEIDKSEFIILCMVRTGAVSPGLVKLMELYFNELDDDKSGKLSIDELLRNRAGANSAAAKLLYDVKHNKKRKGGSRRRRHGARSTKLSRMSSKDHSVSNQSARDEKIVEQQNPYNSVNDDKV